MLASVVNESINNFTSIRVRIKKSNAAPFYYYINNFLYEEIKKGLPALCWIGIDTLHHNIMKWIEHMHYAVQNGREIKTFITASDLWSLICDTSYTHIRHVHCVIYRKDRPFLCTCSTFQTNSLHRNREIFNAIKKLRGQQNLNPTDPIYWFHIYLWSDLKRIFFLLFITKNKRPF